MNDETEPRTISEAGVAPDNRFLTYSGLWSAYQQSIREGYRNDARHTSIMGIYSRRPPEDPAYLREQGMEDMPNFNLGEFTSKVDSYVSTWVDHNTGGYKFFEVKLKREKDTPPEVCDWYDDRATEFFNEAITEWDDDSDTQSAAPYILQSCIRDLQMGLFGIGIPYMKDDVDWRFCAIPTRKVHVPRGTKIDLSNCSVLFVETENTVTGLYSLVKDAPEKSEDDGWNKRAVYRLLYNQVDTDDQKSDVKFSEWENRVRNNDSFVRSDFSQVVLVDCYVQEFSTEKKKEGITHYVIGRSGGVDEILFRQNRQYKSFRSFLVPFSDNSGPEGDWHGVKGFGDSIYDNSHFNNQFFNQMARSAIMSNMPMWMAGDGADRDKLSQIRWTMNGILNPGITLSQVKIQTDINGMMGIFAASQRTMNTNTRSFPTGEAIGQEAKTATQSTFDRQDQAKLSSLQLKFYRMVCLDSLGAEMYQRLSRPNYPSNLPGGRAAKAFRDKCEEARIPSKCYSKPIQVRADRNGGTGNQALDLMIAKEVQAVASPGRGQFNARRGIVKTLVGSDRVDEYIQPEQLPQEQQGYVNLENSSLADGQVWDATPDQDHQVHLGDMSPEGKGHLGLLITTFQVAQQIAEAGVDQALEDAKKVERSLEAGLQHSAQHNQFLSQFGIKAYQEAAKEINKLLNDVGQFLQTFRQQIGAAMQAQQPQGPQMSGEDQAKIMKAQIDIEIKKAFAQQALEQKQQAADMKLGHLAERSAFKNEADRLKLESGLAATQAKQDQQLGHEAIMTLTQQEREAAKTRALHNANQIKE